MLHQLPNRDAGPRSVGAGGSGRTLGCRGGPVEPSRELRAQNEEGTARLAGNRAVPERIRRYRTSLTRPPRSSFSATRDRRLASESASYSAPISRRATRFAWSCWRAPETSSTDATSGGSSHAPRSFRCSPTTSIRRRRSIGNAASGARRFAFSSTVSSARWPSAPTSRSCTATRRLRCPRTAHPATRRCSMMARSTRGCPRAEAQLRQTIRSCATRRERLGGAADL